MTHITHLDHFAVHEAHAQKDGAWSGRIVKITIPLHDITGPDHAAIMKTHALAPHLARKAGIEMTLEVCNECGYFNAPTCHHGLSYWTHRPGCAKYDPSDPTMALPAGLVKMYGEAFPGQEPDDCSGCLLLCPICKNDGT